MYESIVRGENILEPGLPEYLTFWLKSPELGLKCGLESDILTDKPTDYSNCNDKGNYLKDC